jgi:pimeloyl-ACP methyl ester carboxylesterase
MQHFSFATSKDGTRIAYESRGDGPPLVMVHGSTVDRTCWGQGVETLEEHFTLHLVDRRGRGGSGDGPIYGIEREFEDVAAVVDCLEAPVRVFAHSYGAICSLHAALLTPNIAKLVLYEPPMRVAGAKLPSAPDLQDRLDDALARGDRQAVVETFLREVVMVAEDVLAGLKQSRGWSVRLSTAHTLPRELRAASRLEFAPETFRAMHVPTLVLKGGKSPAMFRASSSMTHQALANSRIEVLAGHGHSAMSTGPEVCLAHIVPFLMTTE